jgi:hypothetical protein
MASNPDALKRVQSRFPLATTPRVPKNFNPTIGIQAGEENIRNQLLEPGVGFALAARQERLVRAIENQVASWIVDRQEAGEGAQLQKMGFRYTKHLFVLRHGNTTPETNPTNPSLHTICRPHVAVDTIPFG